MTTNILEAAIGLPKYDEETLKEACKQIYFWQECNSGSFTNNLLDLFCKADMENSARLASAFPELTMAYALWYYAKDSQTFYEKFCEELVK